MGRILRPIVRDSLRVIGNLDVGGNVSITRYISQDITSILPDLDRKYIVSNASEITLTLPATNTDGRTIIIVDGNNFGSFNVILDRNGKTILGNTTNFVLNVANSKIELVYVGGDWKVFAI
jgi:hypothetical protein